MAKTGMTPKQVVARQVDLVTRMESDWFVRWVWESMIRGEPSQEWASVSAATRDAAREAECYRVSEDMSTLVQFAASQLDESDLWDHALAPTPCGLVRFDNPIPLSNPAGATTNAHWLLWGPSPQGSTLFYLFNDLTQPDGVYATIIETATPQAQRSLVQIGPWGPIFGGFVPDGHPMHGERLPPRPADVAQALIEGRPVVPSTNAARYVHALWLLLDQPAVTEVDSEYVPRSTTKAAHRLGLPAKISVVQLRRAEGAAREPGESKSQWTHRWPVRGHWRWQRHGIRGQERRRQWIPPHVKGPEGTPLIAPKKVYDVKR